jgi:hypothetical protein
MLQIGRKTGKFILQVFLPIDQRGAPLTLSYTPPATADPPGVAVRRKATDHDRRTVRAADLTDEDRGQNRLRNSHSKMAPDTDFELSGGGTAP